MSLLRDVQGLIERTYATTSGIADLGPFIIGDEGFRRLSGRHRVVRGPDGTPAILAGAALLVRPEPPRTAISVYFPDALIRRLESRPPHRVLDEDNVDDFAEFIEEVDHFVMVAHALGAGREVTLLELELRANVTKALVIGHFLARHAGRPALHESERLWLRHHLFEKREVAEPEAEVAARYREARRLAVRLLDRLARLSRVERLARLRHWNGLSGAEKVREIATN